MKKKWKKSNYPWCPFHVEILHKPRHPNIKLPSLQTTESICDKSTTYYKVWWQRLGKKSRQNNECIASPLISFFTLWS